MDTMDHNELINGMIHDLGDEKEGITVRGYRNCLIITNVVQALAALQKGLTDEKQAHREQVKLLEDQLNAYAAIHPPAEGETIGGQQYVIDLERGGMILENDHAESGRNEGV